MTKGVTKMKKNKIRLLLPVDGSESSLGAVKYISRFPSFKTAEMVLFHVRTNLPEYYFDLEKDPQYKPYASRLAEIRSWEAEREKQFEEFAQKAKNVFQRAGLPKETVTIKIVDKKQGIARDIVREAQANYSAVVVGRKGAGKLRDIVLGSVSNKLLERIVSIPLCLVGQNPKTGKLLLAFDGSQGSKRAVEFAGRAMGDSGFEIELIHVIRGEQEKYVALAKESMDLAYDELEKSLIKAGFEPDHVSSKIITGARSRAGSIIKEAEVENFGTVIVGRRGLSKVQEFFMGRVGHKVIQMAKKQAVWVVN
jgi:nucleotide-binding universal stress UspA family protein